MPRHSANKTARAFFSRSEIEDSKTSKFRAKEHVCPFGYCSLSLEPVTDPVVTPSGHLYDKASIYEYLSKKLQLYRKSKKRKRKLSKTDNETRKAQKVLKEVPSSFWLPDLTPEVEGDSNMVERPNSPVTGRPLRLNDLMDISLKRNPSNDEDGETGLFLCAASNEELKYQRVYLLKTANVVVSEKAMKNLVLPTNRCPVTNRTCNSGDIVELRGHSKRGSVES